ncbi:MAG: hypothetical protein ACJZZ9_05920 [Cytophagales bacterium]|tara:strand:- start:4140 stop:5714 length:1575 start_codon:yes stop_codon:yes gene_type:complete
MRYFIFSILTLFLISCSDTSEIQKKRMTVTTNSEEAKALFYEAIDAHSGLNWDKAENLMKSAVAKDQNFITAKFLLNSPFVNNTDRKILTDIHNNQLDKVSEMEAIFLRGWYLAATGEGVESRKVFKELTTKYSDISTFWLHSGILKSGGGGGDINDAISDLKKCIEVDPNNYGANAYLMAKHMVVGTLGRMIPVEERDLEVAKMHIDRMIEIDPSNAYGPTYAGNYERAKGNFEKAIGYYEQVGKIPSEDNLNVYQSNHYLALTNTFLKKYDLAESYFRKNIEMAEGGYDRQALFFMPSLHIFANNFDRAIEATGEYLEKLPSLELPYVGENWQFSNTHFDRFLSYSHNQQEDESYNEIDLFAKYRMNIINYNKTSMTGSQYEESKERLDYQVILLNAWHDILFGRYDNAKESLSSARKYVDKWVKENPEAQFPYSDINVFEGMIYLNEGDFNSSISSFEKNIGKSGLGPLGMDNVYFDYFHGLALKGSGRNDEANELFYRIANENFYGIGRALTRELAAAQL